MTSTAQQTSDALDLVAELRRAGLSDVRADRLTRGMYSTDASLYRVVPQVVAFPRHVDELAAVVGVARETGVPVTARGAGTSCAGNAVGPCIVVDTSRYLNRVLGVDPDARTAVVEPGAVHASVQAAARPFGLRLGPDPSSHTRCTVGGMIGNNACGNRALGYGRTSDNVVALSAVTGTAVGIDCRSGVLGDTPSVSDAVLAGRLRDLAGVNLATIRTEFARFGRQVSGYAAENLLPERGLDVAGLLVGSEGTLALVSQATVRLVTDPAATVLVVLGYDDFGSAGDVAPLLKDLGAVASEGIDRRIVDVVVERVGAHAVPDLPRGDAWLMVELPGASRDEAVERARALVAAVPSNDARIVTDPAQARALWRIREDGAGLAGRAPSGRPGHAGWEDAAVPPTRVGAYLRDFDALLAEHGLTCLPYGHIGDGCLHARIDYPLDRPGGVGAYRAFIEAAADLVAAHGGTMSGEHGDGRARSELLPKMYSPAAIALFAGLKEVFDPGNVLNPGVLVDPARFDADLRIPAAGPVVGRLGFSYAADGGDFAQAVHRCTGVGKCRATPAAGGVMCPSYQATREEKDSTRGRARALQEMLNGSLVTDWRDPALHEALDLCLSCKGCASDCPTGIDMATYKAEALHQAYKGRVRPASHYSLGWLPRWSRLASVAPAVANAAMRVPGVTPALLAAAGVDGRRSLPTFAPATFRQLLDSRADADTGASTAPNGPVVLFVDTFVNHFSPSVGVDAVRVLEAAGYEVRVAERQRCCGLTWISTGQLDAAKRLLAATVADLGPVAAQGIPIVGLEPSCTAVLRHDAPDLLGTDAARSVAAATRTLAEVLTATGGWEPPSLAGTRVVAQPHCHQASVLGWDADQALLARAGADVVRLGGCCGLAGNFGVEKGHYEVSVAVAEQQLLPAVRDAAPDDVVLADGFSCRTQLEDLAPRGGTHLATLLAAHL